MHETGEMALCSENQEGYRDVVVGWGVDRGVVGGWGVVGLVGEEMEACFE